MRIEILEPATASGSFLTIDGRTVRCVSGFSLCTMKLRSDMTRYIAEAVNSREQKIANLEAHIKELEQWLFDGVSEYIVDALSGDPADEALRQGILDSWSERTKGPGE